MKLIFVSLHALALKNIMIFYQFKNPHYIYMLYCLSCQAIFYRKNKITKEILRNFCVYLMKSLVTISKAKYIIIEFFKGDLHFQYFVQHINLASTSWKKERENDFSFIMWTKSILSSLFQNSLDICLDNVWLKISFF